MSDENRALVRRELEEVFDEDKLELADELLASDHTVHDSAVAEPVRGIARFKRLRTSYHDASSDVRTTIDDMIADGDKVVTRRSADPEECANGPGGRRLEPRGGRQGERLRDRPQAFFAVQRSVRGVLLERPSRPALP